MEANPNAYFYRHVAPGVVQRTGGWDAEEKKMFMEAVKIHHPSQGKWGLFAQHIPGRVGYQCRNFYHRLLEAGELTAAPGELESIRRGGSRRKRDRVLKRDIPDESEGEDVTLSEDTDDSDPTPPDVSPEHRPEPVVLAEPAAGCPPVAEMEFDVDSLVFFSTKYDVEEPEEEELPMPAQEVVRGQWNPRMRRPWAGAPSDLHFPVHDRCHVDAPEFEYQSARLLRANVENPLNLILLSFPAPKEVSGDYQKAVVQHLILDTQAGKEELLREYFQTMRGKPNIQADQLRSLRSEFAMKVIQTMPV
jgi:hypothetical protein